MTRLTRYETYDFSGNRIETDDKVLRDGQRLRTPLYAMDGVQRSIAENAHSTGADQLIRDALGQMRVVDSQGSTVGLHRPGSRYLQPTNQAQRDAQSRHHERMEKLYEDHAAEEAERWRPRHDGEQSALSFMVPGGNGSRNPEGGDPWVNPSYAGWKAPPAQRDPDRTGYGSNETVGQVEGDRCTVNGTPGRMRMQGGRLVCVPGSGDSRADDLAAAYASYDHAMTHAWRATGDARQSAFGGNDGQRVGAACATVDGSSGIHRREKRPTGLRAAGQPRCDGLSGCRVRTTRRRRFGGVAQARLMAMSTFVAVLVSTAIALALISLVAFATDRGPR